VQFVLLQRGKRREGLQQRTVIGLENLHPMPRRAVAEHEFALAQIDRRGARPEHLADARLGAPERGRLHAGRRRHLPADRLEHLADEAFRRPVGEADLAAGLADTQKLGRGPVLVGREHHAEGRDHGVERAVGEGERLGVGLLELDAPAFGVGARPAALKQRRDIVGRDDVAPAPRGRERGVAVAGGAVQPLLARAQVERLAKILADDLQRRADDGVIAGRPGALLAGLQGGEIGGRGGGGGKLRCGQSRGVHGRSLMW